VVVQEGAPHIYEPACAAHDLFRPGLGQTRGRIEDVYARIVELVSRGCADPGPETTVTLGQVRLRANVPLTPHDVRPVGRRVVLNNTLLFELLLCLWDRVEQCCAGPPPTAAPTPAPTVAPTVAPTIPPTVPPTAGPTVAPTVRPTVSPTAPPTPTPTIRPTIAPPSLLRVGSVRFIHQSTGPADPEVEVAVMRDPRQPVPVPARGRANAIEVGFTPDARVEPRSLQDQVTVVVVGPAGRVPGRIAPVAGANAFRWTAAEQQEFRGEFKVGLIGDGTSAIVSTDGKRLDGEPRALPSGDGNEGGNFEFAFTVS
jgi:hypothetical protein